MFIGKKGGSGGEGGGGGAYWHMKNISQRLTLSLIAKKKSKAVLFKNIFYAPWSVIIDEQDVIEVSDLHKLHIDLLNLEIDLF